MHEEKENEILEELYRFREDFDKRFNYDIHAMFEYLREKDREHPELLARTPAHEPRPGEPRAA